MGTVYLRCPACGGRMYSRRVATTTCTGFAGGLILIVFGSLISLTLVGAILGIPMIVGGLAMGGSRKKSWVCQHCGHYIARA